MSFELAVRKSMEESWKIRHERDGEDDSDTTSTRTLLLDEFDGSDAADDYELWMDSRRRNWRPSLWCALAIVSVLTGRRLLTTGFRESSIP